MSHVNHAIPRSVASGDPAHRVCARLREPGPIPRPAPGATAGHVGRVLRLLREHSPMDPRIRRGQPDARRTAAPIRAADESPLAAGSTPSSAGRAAGMQSYRRGVPETTLTTDCQTLTDGRTLVAVTHTHNRRILSGSVINHSLKSARTRLKDRSVAQRFLLRRT